MGRNKALLPGRLGSLLDDACEKLIDLLGQLGLSDECLYVSGDFPGRRCIHDRLTARGPLSGIHAAFAHFLELPAAEAPTSVLFLPVDMPGLKRGTIEALVRGGLGLPAANFRGFELPAIFGISRASLDLLRGRLEAPGMANSDLSMRWLLLELGSREIDCPPDAGGEFVNLNTPQEFGEWEGGAL